VGDPDEGVVQAAGPLRRPPLLRHGNAVAVAKHDAGVGFETDKIDLHRVALGALYRRHLARVAIEDSEDVANRLPSNEGDEATAGRYADPAHRVVADEGCNRQGLCVGTSDRQGERRHQGGDQESIHAFHKPIPWGASRADLVLGARSRPLPDAD